VERIMFGLGDLEEAVMVVLWRTDRPARVRDVLEQLDPDRPLAYTTVMTVLDNLHRKGWVRRNREGRAYHYRPALSREDATVRALRDVLNASGDPAAALLRFARSASNQEADVLRAALAEKSHRG
jgi:predicted transcriptional regulator